MLSAGIGYQCFRRNCRAQLTMIIGFGKPGVVINACFCLVLVIFTAHFGKYRTPFWGNFDRVFYRQWFGRLCNLRDISWIRIGGELNR